MKLRGKLSFRVACVLSALLLAVVTPAATVSAYSAQGAGTSNKPYLITTCQQLQEMTDELSAHYKLMRNIDCRSFGPFAAIGNSFTDMPFTGTLDGNHYSIVGMQVTNGGLFGSLSNATVKDLRLTDSAYTIATSVYAGTLADFAYISTIANVHSDVTVDGSGPSVGGIIGAMQGGTIENSSFTGTLNTGTNMAGLAGQADDVQISDSYSAATFGNGQRIGGLVVSLGENTVIERSYSAADFGHTTFSKGGIATEMFGIEPTSLIQDSFSASTLGSSDIYVGAILGSPDMFGFSGSPYYDSHLAGGVDCAGESQVPITCVPVNIDDSEPDYFKGNSTATPLDAWDFTANGPWQIVSGDYPELRSKAAFKPLALNDQNGDGTDDSYQGHVMADTDNQNKDITFTIPDTSDCIITGGGWSSESVDDDQGYAAELPNYADVDIYCKTPGATVPVTIIFDKKYVGDLLTLRNYNTRTHQFSSVPGAVLSTVTINGTQKTSATYTLTEDSALDSDTNPNDGIIRDPIMLASASSVAPVASENTDTPGAPNAGVARQSIDSLGDLSRNNRIALALFTATLLSLIVLGTRFRTFVTSNDSRLR